ncbi:Calmodulin [Balamuthia mandrillaris]
MSKIVPPEKTEDGVPLISKLVFDKYDADGSGEISASELKEMAYDLGYFLTDEEAEIAFKLIDEDGNGGITYEEFLHFWRQDERFKKFQRSKEELELLQHNTRYFRYFDKDNNGVLDKEEFRGLHADLVKNNMTKHNFEELWETLDRDQSGFVSFNEYIAWLGY